jgi:serine/threonine protein phosphatase PrpC
MRVSQGSAASNTGRKRRHNEDAYVYDPPLFAVADGMGGARAGEIASALAAAALREADLDPAESAESAVVRLIQSANERVHERALSDAAASGMGTTMTVALFRPEGNVVIGHVGDSRAYLLRDGKLEQLTDDHSLVAELVRRGELSPEQAEVHPQRSVITRALGTEPEVDVDAFTVAARDGDVFLLCSDGLTTMVDAATIAELVQRDRFELTSASRALIRVANERGGEDNITTVLFAIAADENTLPAEHEQDSSRGFEDDDTIHPEDRVEAPQIELGPPADTVIVRAGERLAVSEGEPVPPRPPLARLMLAQLLVVVLAALIVLLVVKGFAQ